MAASGVTDTAAAIVRSFAFDGCGIGASADGTDCATASGVCAGDCDWGVCGVADGKAGTAAACTAADGASATANDWGIAGCAD
ncbi:hypothetical protein [Lysobacter gummosus]|uniref:hypothetical protein n=1 Tax=Lysobacter gummosus TaxID=262324 RepID=UPI00363EC654